MDQIDLRAAAVGFVAGVLGCRAVAVLVGLSGPRPALVLAVAQLGVLILVGAVVAVLQRRRLGLWTRTAALRTTLTAAGAGLVVALVLDATAVALQGGPGVMPVTVLIEAMVWLGGPALGCVLVRPGDARVRAVGVVS
jgi:hypothetical protein